MSCSCNFKDIHLLNIGKDGKLEIVEIRKRGIMEAAQGVIQRRRLAAQVLEPGQGQLSECKVIG